LAEALIRQYDLAVLKVTLLPGSPSREMSSQPSAESMAQVQFQLQKPGDGQVGSTPLNIPARDMGIPRYLDWEMLRGRGKYSFEMPSDVAQWLRANIGATDRPDGALWLNLVKPYGYLGMFPWESLLKPLLSCAILRLPDFVIDPPQQTPSIIDVALCCQLGNADPSSTVDLLLKTAKALSSSGGRRPVRITAFADGEVYARLAQSSIAKSIPRLSLCEVDVGESFLTTYVVNPITALGNPIREWLRKFGNSEQKSGLPSSKDLLAAATDPIKSPWLRAVRKLLGQQSMDVIHVLTNAMLSLENGVLLLDQGDLKSNSPSSYAVSTQEFLAFQAQVGAWAVGFSSASNSFSDMALRQFADGLAQLRPGPLLYHDATVDPASGSLSDTYAFLLAEAPTTPRQSPAIFTYCEPFRVFDDQQPDATLESLSNRYARSNATLQVNDSVRSVFQTSENVPSWVAASERFIDLYKLRLAELSSKSGVRSGQIDEIRSTLSRLQDTVAKVVKDGGS
jgi:hypothetical protein